MKRLFNPEDIRVLIRWATAYYDSKKDTPEELISQEFHSEQELAELIASMKECSSEVMLGALNICFLLGFDSYDTGYPLVNEWNAMKDKIPDETKKSEEYLLIEKFLAEAGFIPRFKVENEEG